MTLYTRGSDGFVSSAAALIASGWSEPSSRGRDRAEARAPRSPSRLTNLYTESSDSFVASIVVSIASGWSEPVPGREFHPLKSSAFHGALLQQSLERGWFRNTEKPTKFSQTECLQGPIFG